MNVIPPLRQLEDLFMESMDSVLHRERSTFDRLAAPFAESIVLFGAGGIGRKTLTGLRKKGIEPLVFADNNPALWGKEIDGLRVLSVPEAAHRYGGKAVFVITIWTGEGKDAMGHRRRQLLDLHCARVVPFAPLYWKYPEIFLPHYSFDMAHNVYAQSDDVLRAFHLWEDTASQREYLAQIRWRTLLDFDGLPLPVSHKIYFPEDLVRLTFDESFFDLGAFDGDTIRSFLEIHGTSFGEICAFEPDPTNFNNLEKYVSSLPPSTRAKIRLHQLAVGAREEIVTIDATGTGSSAVGTGTTQVDCVTLDRFLGSSRTTFIKMDIEGSEADALLGARRMIGNHIPLLAICVYHRQNHLWMIPNLIRSMSDEYCFFLRPHLLEVWDLVCYAIPRHRLRRTAGP